MSFDIDSIRKAFESRLRDTSGLALPIAYENVNFTRPVDGGAYVESRLLPADPDGSMLGSEQYIERGVYQVTLVYPQGKGPGDSDSKAKLLRQRFARGTTLVKDGVSVVVTHVPALRAGFPADGQWRVPMSVRWQAEVSAQ
jgi:hypothetical protein